MSFCSVQLAFLISPIPIHKTPHKISSSSVFLFFFLSFFFKLQTKYSTLVHVDSEPTRTTGRTIVLNVSNTACHIAVVLLLVGTNYSADARWKNKEPSLGWSFWDAMSAVVCSLLAAITLTFRYLQSVLNITTIFLLSLFSKSKPRFRNEITKEKSVQ